MRDLPYKVRLGRFGSFTTVLATSTAESACIFLRYLLKKQVDPLDVSNYVQVVINDWFDVAETITEGKWFKKSRTIYHKERILMEIPLAIHRTLKIYVDDVKATTIIERLVSIDDEF